MGSTPTFLLGSLLDMIAYNSERKCNFSVSVIHCQISKINSFIYKHYCHNREHIYNVCKKFVTMNTWRKQISFSKVLKWDHILHSTKSRKLNLWRKIITKRDSRFRKWKKWVHIHTLIILDLNTRINDCTPIKS